MAGDATGAAAASKPLGRRVKEGFESKILVPAAATIVGAAASYLVRKLPLLLEQKVLPRLRESDLPKQVTDVVEQASQTLGGHTDAGEAGGNADDDPQEQAPPGHGSTAKSNDEREAGRREREQRRQERKRALDHAA